MSETETETETAAVAAAAVARPREAVFGDILANAHALQVVANPAAGYVSATDVAFARVLAEDAPRLAYRRRRDEVKSVIHWGQRKLLLSEIEFLTLYHGQFDTVVYAGAAPGTHMPYLVELFPGIKFVLVDPAPFFPRLASLPTVELRQEFFTAEMAAEFCGKGRVVFVCDVRSGDPSIMSSEEVEAAVKNDMDRQMDWHLKMKPVATMLKFRLPYGAGVSPYLAGKVYLPVWGPITTSEGRLVCEGDAVRDYDHTAYEEQMFYFNCHTRVARYRHSVRDVAGLDFCYDCRAEVEILQRYLGAHRGLEPATSADAAVAEMSLRINQVLGSRTLADPNSDPGERRQGIKNHQFIEGRPAYLPAKRTKVE